MQWHLNYLSRLRIWLILFVDGIVNNLNPSVYTYKLSCPLPVLICVTELCTRISFYCVLARRYLRHKLQLLHSTPWSRVLLEKLKHFQLDKKFSAIYGTRKFVTTFKIARHLSLFWASSIQPIPPHSNFLKIHLNNILPSSPGSPKWSLSFRFSNQNTVYSSPHTRYMLHPSHSSLFYHPNCTGWGVETIKLLSM